MCESKGWRLCSRYELTAKAASGCCTNDQCGYDDELVWTAQHGGAQYELCSKDEHCNFAGCMGICVDGACFKGLFDSKCDNMPDNFKLDDGDWCLQGISGHHCPAQVGSIDGKASIVLQTYQTPQDRFLTVDVHAPQMITRILIKGSPQSRPWAVTSKTCMGQYLNLPLTFGPVIVSMLILSRTSPYKGAQWGIIIGYICLVLSVTVFRTPSL